jgi:hypothetical protein
MSREVFAVQVLGTELDASDLSTRWEELVEEPSRARGAPPPRLVVLRSPYRETLHPLVGYVKQLASENPHRLIAVVVPQLVERQVRYYLMHNYTAAVLRTMLVYRGGPRIVVVEVPWYMADVVPERAAVRARLTFRHAR